MKANRKLLWVNVKLIICKKIGIFSFLGNIGTESLR